MDSLISKTQTSLCLIFILLLAPITSFAHNTENASGVQRQLLSSDVLPNVPAHKLTSMTVVLQPGVSVGAHKHDGFVYAYVLQGSVRTQLNNGEVVEYNVGDRPMGGATSGCPYSHRKC